MADGPRQPFGAVLHSQRHSSVLTESPMWVNSPAAWPQHGSRFGVKGGSIASVLFMQRGYWEKAAVRQPLRARKVLGWPKRRKLAHAFL